MKSPVQSLICIAAAAFVLSPVAGTLVGQEMMPGPGPEHQALKKLEGTWEAKIKSGTEESTGSMVYKMECGGLWLASEFHGEFGGMKFEGRGLDGYDPLKKKYVSVWVDSMSFRPLIFEGEMDEAKQQLTLTGEGRGPDGQTMKFKSVTRMRDADHMDFTMSTIDSGGEATEMISIEYVRK